MSLALSLRTTGDIPQAQTKMTADITQDKASFRGIEQVYVIPFQTESAIPVSMGNTRLGNRNVYINRLSARQGWSPIIIPIYITSS